MLGQVATGLPAGNIADWNLKAGTARKHGSDPDAAMTSRRRLGRTARSWCFVRFMFRSRKLRFQADPKKAFVFGPSNKGEAGVGVHRSAGGIMDHYHFPVG